MAAPVDSARVATSALTGTPYTINVGSPVAGTLLIVLVRFAGAVGTITFTGYTALNGAGGDASDASDDVTFIAYRWADGTEGVSDSLTTVTGAIKGCALSWEITGAENEAPAISTVAVGTTTLNTANPTSVAPNGAPADTLYLALMGLDGELNTPTASPTSYSTITTANSGTAAAVTTNCSVGGGSRQITASSSDDPGVFTHPAANAGWTAYTLAIREAVVAAPGPASSQRQRRASRFLTNR